MSIHAVLSASAWRVLAVMAVIMMGLSVNTVMAQTTDEPTQATAEALTPVENTELGSATPSSEAAPPPISQDEIAEKLRALEAAEQDFLKAARQQFGTDAGALNGDSTQTETVSDIEITPVEPRKSLIPTDPEAIKALGQNILNKIIGWLTSPPFLAQIGAIILAWFLAPIVAKRLRSALFFLRDPPKKGDRFHLIRHYVFEASELLRPALVILLLAIFAAILKASLGQDWLVKLAQGLAVVSLLYAAIKQFAPNDLFRKLGVWVLIPLALLVVFGFFDELLGFLDAIALGSGDNPISLLTLIKLGIFGGIFFWLGNFSNEKGQTAIRSQEGIDIGIREIISKFLQIAIFGAAAVMAMSAAGIGLGGLVAIFAAMSLGVGLGLQPIAANFVSGLIILFDRSVRIGDFVVLPNGQEGFVEAINMRSTTVETADGKDIMVPNTQFTEEAYENWTHKDPRQRYEVHFAVPYDTDLDSLEAILMPAILKYPKMLTDPEEPDLELRGFGNSGINMAIEFWCEGIDDGPNKFTSDVNFIVWRTLKAHGIKMPYPQRDVHLIKTDNE